MMAMKKETEKTNVMRLLSQNGINYRSYCYGDGNLLSGMEVAKALNRDENRVFKTLVTVGHSGNNYVFVIPVNCELNLKKAAKAAQEKNIEMIHSRQLLPLTGYIHGGCSPIGMKKLFPTFVDERAILFDSIIFSAGKIGYQVELSVEDLNHMIPIELKDVADQN